MGEFNSSRRKTAPFLFFPAFLHWKHPHRPRSDDHRLHVEVVHLDVQIFIYLWGWIIRCHCPFWSNGTLNHSRSIVVIIRRRWQWCKTIANCQKRCRNKVSKSHGGDGGKTKQKTIDFVGFCGRVLSVTQPIGMETDPAVTDILFSDETIGGTTVPPSLYPNNNKSRTQTHPKINQTGVGPTSV